MSIRKIEWAVFIQSITERKFDAVTLGWSLGVESDPYQLWHSSQAEAGSNFVGFKNSRADVLIEEAREEFSRILHEQQPYTLLFARKSTVLVHRRFHNVRLYPLGLDTREWFVPEGLHKY